ncbi:MAG: hypothetical protein KGL35_08170 [Bradyrhizobium sp.]|nr:hypothetical protein [Bradyrhizobium sp.]
MRLRLVDWTARRAHVAVQIPLEPRGLWIGVFWQLHRHRGTITGLDNKHGAFVAQPWNLHVYICAVPMLPIHVYVSRTVRPRSEGDR